VLSFLSGLSLGFGAAIPLGPINILIMSNALKSYKGAVAIGFGAMSADIIYLFLILNGTLLISDNSIVIDTLAIVGAIFLLYIAWQIFKNRNSEIETTKERYENSLIKNYLKGLSLTLLNPYTIGFWLSVSTTVATNNLSPLLTLAGVVCAIIAWITLMPLAVYRSKHLISTKVASIFSIFSALIMTYFAVTLLRALF